MPHGYGINDYAGDNGFQRGLRWFADGVLPGNQHGADGHLINVGSGAALLGGQLVGNAVAPGLGTGLRKLYGKGRSWWNGRQYGQVGGYDPSALVSSGDYTHLTGPSFNVQGGGTDPYMNHGGGDPRYTGGGFSNGQYGISHFDPAQLQGGNPFVEMGTDLYGPSLHVQQGNDSGGHYSGGMTGGVSSGYHGNSSGGTLGGHVVDPSLWGMFGFGGTDAGNGATIYRPQTGMTG